MSGQAPFSLRGRNPDVLTCIANLSSDEIFTPPDFANNMLDALTKAWASAHEGADIWSNSSIRFLDPCAKSGVFLREITSRLINGLAREFPNLQHRVDHILTNQVYGIALTRLTSLLTRRTLYCSRTANSEHSVVKTMQNSDGQIWFQRTEHNWIDGGQCDFCGASAKTLARGEGLETHAYAFIHTRDIKKSLVTIFGGKMQFDVIIGNPPYQLSDGGHGASATTIYHLFVEKALALDPRYAMFVTPSRWMTGGRGLNGYRDRMLSDKRMRSIVDYPKLYEGFPGVKIRGGISYFLWDREHYGPCDVQTICDGEPTGPIVARHLDAYDVVVRRNEAVSIVEKVKMRGESTLNRRIASSKPFGLRTNFRGRPTTSGMKDPVRLYQTQGQSWIQRKDILSNPDWIDEWKVLMTRTQGTSGKVENKFLSKPIIAGPNSACTETYLVAGHFNNEVTAFNYSLYLRTRFVRFLVSLRKVTQDAARGVYSFVPDLPLNREWTDAMLYNRYRLTSEEISFIESQVALHDDEKPKNLRGSRK